MNAELTQPAAEAPLATVTPINAEAAAAMQAAEQPAASVGDIVAVDANSRGHRPDGKFLSNHEMSAIEAHADQIRAGQPALAKERVSDLVQIDSSGRGHRPDGKFLSNHELTLIDAHRDQIRTGLATESEPTEAGEAVAAEPEVDEAGDLAAEIAQLEAALARAQAKLNGETLIDTAPAAETAAIEPVSDDSPQGLRARAKRIFSQAADKLKLWAAKGYNALAQGRQEQAEEGWTTKRKIMAGAIGATLVAAGAVLAYKGVGAHHATEASQPSGRGLGNFNVPVAPGSGGHHIAEVINLHKGGTEWQSVHQYADQLGHHNLSDHQVYDLVDATLKGQGISWEQARHLPVGYPMHMLSPEQVNEVLGQAA